ncbi:MAG: outer membrane beta-barrel protein [Acidobacteriaceae bacterium]|nr:outer membrane beta-barrel protein [Acidobacteriaceae bacterium]
MKKFRSCLFVLALLAVANSSRGQAVPAGYAPPSIQIGGGISYGNTDIFTKKVSGVTIYATYGLGRHLEAEADAHLMWLSTPDDYLQSSYMLGPRYVWHYRRYDPYVKVLLGIGHGAASSDRKDITHIGPQALPVSTFAYAPGGGVDVHVTHHWNVRGDFEYQQWPGFKENGLTPWVLTGGVAYRFH